jgi:hypothetical protein
MNIPIVRNFVDLLYSHVFDLCSKNKHRLVRILLVRIIRERKRTELKRFGSVRVEPIRTRTDILKVQSNRT